MAKQTIDRVALNFTDLTGAKTGCVKLGSNKFWIGEVVKNDDGTFDYLCQWGPTGEVGSTNGSKYNIGEEKARKMLEAKVKSKKKKGYTELLTRSKDEETAKAAAKGVDLTTGNAKAPKKTPKKTPGRTFHPDVQRLLGIIYNENSRTVRAGLSDTAGATEDNPIGNLSDQQLDIGGGILDKIEAALLKEFGHESSANRGTALPLRRDGTPSNTIINLTNEFMSNVPRRLDSGMRGRANLHRVVISSYERLEEQRKFLQLLRDAHLSQATFSAAAHSTTVTDKVGVWYDGLNCEIESVEQGSSDFQHVKNLFDRDQSRGNANWFRGGKCILQVVNVFKFTRNSSDVAFDLYASRVCNKPGAVGRINTWHGTRTENLLGIGKTGLLMPENLPRGVYRAGAAFGRGVYHAPVWGWSSKVTEIGGYPVDGTNGALKSANYTSSRGAYYGSGNTATTAFMFLQDVALGQADVRTSACWDQPRPTGWPNKDFIFACSARNKGGFVHDELVTFDQNAQVFRYLVEIAVR